MVTCGPPPEGLGPQALNLAQQVPTSPQPNVTGGDKFEGHQL